MPLCPAINVKPIVLRIGVVLILGLPAGRAVESLSVLTYNTSGNGVADWSTNSAQVQAIGREVSYLQPDIITFQEIPFTNTWQMPNFVAAFLPGYHLATNSGTDGYIRSVILSRFPINRSKSWMARSNLTYFGYNGPFTRDLFEAEIAVPGFAAPLHVFTTHLKSGTDATSQQRRASESAAISNFFAAVFLPTNTAPYLLTGDMNEDLARSSNPQALSKLTGAPTGLRLTTPVNSFSGSELTISIQTGLFSRYDYILPGAMLFSNIAGSQVFRTDLLYPVPSNLYSNDDETASDHLPVLMTFANPFNTPFRLLSFGVTNQIISLKWESQNNRVFNIEASTNLTTWTPFATNIATTTDTFSFTTNLTDSAKFFRVYRAP
jgi:endonuclease/exonuclease/phosphatase family metal-dependent hydrolase